MGSSAAVEVARIEDMLSQQEPKCEAVHSNTVCSGAGGPNRHSGTA